MTLIVLPAGYKYDLLHVQTRPIASEVLCANADAAALAFDGQQAWDEHRVRTITESHLRLNISVKMKARTANEGRVHLISRVVPYQSQLFAALSQKAI